MGATSAWWEGPLVGFDLETTGPEPDEARIVTACVVRDVPGQDPVAMSWLVDPGVEIPDGATDVHGVTTERARAEGQPARAAVSRILEVLAAEPSPLVAFNAAFDFTVLDREARRHGLGPLVPHPVIDPFVLDKQADRFRRGSRKLVDVAAHYGVRLDDAHTAEADALAAVGIARAIGRGEPHPPESAQVLHQGQIQWRGEQCRSLAEYFARQGRDEHVEPAWPVHPIRESVAS